MSTHIPLALRRAVILRANGRCEYCGKPQIGFIPHEVDHVIAQKHGGATTVETLHLRASNAIVIKAVILLLLTH